MSASTLPRPGATPPPRERRLPPGAHPMRRAWRWLRALLRRPVGWVGEPGHRRLGFVERRKRPPDALAVGLLCTELRQALLSVPAERVDTRLRQLVQVHDELARTGWAGVGALPPAVLRRALSQADELRREAPSAALRQLAERLRGLLAAAPAAPAPAAASVRTANTDSPEVSEASHEDFEASRRSWFDDLPPPAAAGPAESPAPRA